VESITARMEVKNIFSKIPKDIPKELFEQIISSNDIKIERIISKGHQTEEGKWYDQNKNELVILLKGNAKLMIKEENKDVIIKMKAGDYINIPKHVKHRVEKTSQKEETIWLAIFY